MDKTQKIFDIIRFTADKIMYYGASIELPQILLDTGNYTKHTDVNIPIGHSRYGGPIVDLPLGIEYPKDLLFAAQLDLSKFSPFDKSGLLPKSGQLLFFANIRNDTGKVFYVDIPNDNLVRHIKEHDDDFFSGRLVDKIYSDTETLSERVREPEDDEMDYVNKDGKIWDETAGSEKSKIYGMFTHCQYGQEEIEKIIFSGKILLLQVGENDFNDEGVFSVLIDKSDLQNKIFDNCEFAWGQS
ncbi:hypothetical protein BH11BAC5_BH11BAC5_52940 [soil metagenome]